MVGSNLFYGNMIIFLDITLTFDKKSHALNPPLRTGEVVTKLNIVLRGILNLSLNKLIMQNLSCIKDLG